MTKCPHGCKKRNCQHINFNRQTVIELTNEQLWVIENEGVKYRKIRTFERDGETMHEVNVNLKGFNVNNFFKGKLAKARVYIS